MEVAPAQIVVGLAVAETNSTVWPMTVIIRGALADAQVVTQAPVVSQFW